MKRGILALAVLAAILVPASPAAANPACVGSPANHFDGRKDTTPTNYRGAQIDIVHRWGSLCTTNSYTHFSWSWSLLGDDDLGSPTYGGRIQIGSAVWGGGNNCGCSRFVWEWGASDDFITRGVFGSPGQGATFKYQANVYLSDGRGHMLLYDYASQRWVTPPHNKNGDPPVTNFNPMTDWSNKTPMFMGEILFYQSNYPGSSNAKQIWSIGKLRQTGGTWVNTNFATGWLRNQGGCFAKQEDVSATSFRTWTYPLSHNGNNC
jgi:hypothetical protein